MRLLAQRGQLVLGCIAVLDLQERLVDLTQRDAARLHQGHHLGRHDQRQLDGDHPAATLWRLFAPLSVASSKTRRTSPFVAEEEG